MQAAPEYSNSGELLSLVTIFQTEQRLTGHPGGTVCSLAPQGQSAVEYANNFQPVGFVPGLRAKCCEANKYGTLPSGHLPPDLTLTQTKHC